MKRLLLLLSLLLAAPTLIAQTTAPKPNLFVLPVDGIGTALVQQLTDVAPRRGEPPPTDSQKFIRDEQEKLLEVIREQKERKKKADERARQDKLPARTEVHPGERHLYTVPIGGGTRIKITSMTGSNVAEVRTTSSSAPRPGPTSTSGS